MTGVQALPLTKQDLLLDMLNRLERTLTGAHQLLLALTI